MEAFEVLLRGFKCLERFSCTHDCWIRDDEGGSPYNAPGIVKALGDSAARSLKSLHLEVALWNEFLRYEEDQQYIGPLRMFQSLTSIHVQDHVFRIWEIADDSPDGKVESSARHGLVPYAMRGVPYRMDQLENIPRNRSKPYDLSRRWAMIM
ncbi:MAG: hypothetical protein Q9228_007018 [Teloschistes exilis]